MAGNLLKGILTAEKCQFSDGRIKAQSEIIGAEKFIESGRFKQAGLRSCRNTGRTRHG